MPKVPACTSSTGVRRTWGAMRSAVSSIWVRDGINAVSIEPMLSQRQRPRPADEAQGRQDRLRSVAGPRFPIFAQPVVVPGPSQRPRGGEVQRLSRLDALPLAPGPDMSFRPEGPDGASGEDDVVPPPGCRHQEVDEGVGGTRLTRTDLQPDHFAAVGAVGIDERRPRRRAPRGSRRRPRRSWPTIAGRPRAPRTAWLEPRRAAPSAPRSCPRRGRARGPRATAGATLQRRRFPIPRASAIAASPGPRRCRAARRRSAIEPLDRWRGRPPVRAPS